MTVKEALAGMLATYRAEKAKEEQAQKTMIQRETSQCHQQ